MKLVAIDLKFILTNLVLVWMRVQSVLIVVLHQPCRPELLYRGSLRRFEL